MKRGLPFIALVLFCILFTISCKKDDEQEETGISCLLETYQGESITMVYAYDANDRLYKIDYLDAWGLSTDHTISFLDTDEDGRTDRIEQYYEDTLFLFSEIKYEDNVGGGETAKGKWEYTDEREGIDYEYEFDEQGRRVKYTRKLFDPLAGFEIIHIYVYTWENDNVVKISYQPNYTRSTDLFYTYDHKKNPYHRFDNAWEISQDYSLDTRSKNNPIKVTVDGDVVNRYTYTYDHHNYPISATGKMGKVEFSYTRCELIAPD